MCVIFVTFVYSKSKDTTCSYSIFTECPFDNRENKHDHNKAKHCMKNCSIYVAYNIYSIRYKTPK